MGFKYSLEAIIDHVEKKQPGWVGFDMDGTLAKYTKWEGWDKFGDPVPSMCEKAKKLIAAGVDVRIFTARASKVSLARNGITYEQMEKAIQDWTEKHLGKRLPVSTEKDCWMFCFFDDSCVQVEKNTGKILGFEIPIDLGGDADFKQPIVEFDSSEIKNQLEFNEVVIPKTQIMDFASGLIKSGYSSVDYPDVRGAQVGVVATNDENQTSFYLNTFTGELAESEKQTFIQLDVYVAAGSNRYCFKYENLSFKSLGKWIADKVLHS